jgi:hypothetical protein
MCSVLRRGSYYGEARGDTKAEILAVKHRGICLHRERFTGFGTQSRLALGVLVTCIPGTTISVYCGIQPRWNRGWLAGPCSRRNATFGRSVGVPRIRSTLGNHSWLAEVASLLGGIRDRVHIDNNCRRHSVCPRPQWRAILRTVRIQPTRFAETPLSRMWNGVRPKQNQGACADSRCGDRPDRRSHSEREC